MDRDVESFVKRYRGCILVSAPDAPEPMRRRQMPSGPWQEIAVDFLGPLPEGQWLFVVVDYYSRFTEVVEMTNMYYCKRYNSRAINDFRQICNSLLHEG